ncbi:sulfatase [Citrobacter koseri]|uniref:Sulfatase n=1 Tax=Citrobacter koseri TaxID=545 RepID=A0A2X2WSJ5_CITKO|nr:sulfatase [Citrobacter koseri]
MTRPNFLFIMTDTQATNMVGCYSGKPLNTQHIDSLAAEGIRFNSAYTCSPGVYASPRGAFYRYLCQSVRPVDEQRRTGEEHLHDGALF